MLHAKQSLPYQQDGLHNCASRKVEDGSNLVLNDGREISPNATIQVMRQRMLNIVLGFWEVCRAQGKSKSKQESGISPTAKLYICKCHLKKSNLVTKSRGLRPANVPAPICVLKVYLEANNDLICVQKSNIRHCLLPNRL